MGEKDNRLTGGTDTGAGDRPGSNSTSTADTRAGAGDSAGGTAGAGAGTEKEKNVPQLAVVGEELTDEQKRLERNRKRRERYANQKAESGQTVKPRKVNQTKGKPTTVETMTTEQLNKLLVSTSAVIASRPNCSHWLITEAEANTITTPLLAIIAESKKLEAIAQNSNQIALAIACITVFAPRLFVTVQMSKMTKPKKEKQTNVITDRKTRVTETEIKKSDDVNVGNVAANNQDDGVLLSWDD